MSIRPSGTYQDIPSPSNDLQLNAASGTHLYSRQFSISPLAVAGSYDLAMAIWDGYPGPPSRQIQSSGWKNGILTVTAPPQPFDFSISLSDSSKTITAGQSASIQIIVNLVSGTSHPVSISCSGIPSSEAACGISPTIVSPSGTSTLTINTGSGTDPNTYVATISGSGNGVTH